MSNYDRVRERLVKYRLEQAKVSPSTATEERVETIQDAKTDDEQPEYIEHVDNDLERLEQPGPSQTSSKTGWILFILKILLWCILQAFFVEIEFGVVFFVGSCLFFIVASLRGSKRNPSELSAYSVFNKNFEQIEGTLTAEQFEKEIRHGPASVR